MKHDFFMVSTDGKSDRRQEELFLSLSKKEKVTLVDFPEDINLREESVLVLPFFINDDRASLFLESCPEGTLVFGGHPTDKQSGIISEKGLCYTDVLSDEEFCRDNALITAEGALSLIINSTDETLWSMRVALFGYGRIGQRLVRMLLGLGATVRVFTSNEDELNLAKTRGISACHLWQRDNMDIFKALVNTVPLRHVIDEDTLSSLSESAYILDLASGENNVNWRVMNSLMLRGEKASSLPTKISPKSAARAVERTIFRHLN